MSSNCAMRSRWFISSLSIGSFFKSSISWEVGSKWYVDSNPGPASDYDSGWFNINDTSLNNVLKTHNLGTMFPKVELFVWKIVHGGRTYYFDMNTNQYGDANQTNGARLSFRNSLKMLKPNSKSYQISPPTNEPSLKIDWRRNQSVMSSKRLKN